MTSDGTDNTPKDDLAVRIQTLKQKVDDDAISSSDPHKNNKPRASNGGAFRAGGELLGGILGGLLLGYCADATFSTKPFGMVIGLMLGIIAGFYGVYRITSTPTSLGKTASPPLPKSAKTDT